MKPPESSPVTPRRALCPRCTRPLPSCLCALVTPLPHRCRVLVLQHPQELRQTKNSVGLLRGSLGDCQVQVGERFSAAQLADWLHPPGRQSLLLYPATAELPAPPATPAPLPPPEALQLVVLDATWRKSLRLLSEHPALQALPRLSLATPPTTRYRAIRKARREDQVSTLEACCHALAQLEGAGWTAEPLLAAFGRFVEQVQRQRAPQGPAADAGPA